MLHGNNTRKASWFRTVQKIRVPPASPRKFVSLYGKSRRAVLSNTNTPILSESIFTYPAVATSD
jgi:hypothetical protein